MRNIDNSQTKTRKKNSPSPEKSVALAAHQSVRVEGVSHRLCDAPREDHACVPRVAARAIVSLANGPDHEETGGDLNSRSGNRRSHPPDRGVDDLEDGQTLHSGDERSDVHHDLAGSAEKLSERLGELSVGRGQEDAERTESGKQLAREDDRVGWLLRAKGEVLEHRGENEDPSEEGNEIEDDQVQAHGQWLLLLS